MKYTPEENKDFLEMNSKMFCPLSFSSSSEIMFCQTLKCMLYDDIIHECALGRKTRIDEENSDD